MIEGEVKNKGARMGKRGPQPLGFDVELRTRITAGLDASLDQMAGVVGVSKATLVRVALMELVGGVPGRAHAHTHNRTEQEEETVTINIPDYPAADGPNIAMQLKNGRGALAAGADALDHRIAAMDDAMVAALDAQADRQNARDRVRSFVKGVKGRGK